MKRFFIAIMLIFPHSAVFSAVCDLDTTFSSDAIQVTDIGTSSIHTGNAIAIQFNNKFIVAGTTSSGSNDFAAIRYIGDTSSTLLVLSEDSVGTPTSKLLQLSSNGTATSTDAGTLANVLVDTVKVTRQAQATDGVIHNNGKIISVGSETA